MEQCKVDHRDVDYDSSSVNDVFDIVIPKSNSQNERLKDKTHEWGASNKERGSSNNSTFKEAGMLKTVARHGSSHTFKTLEGIEAERSRLKAKSYVERIKLELLHKKRLCVDLLAKIRSDKSHLSKLQFAVSTIQSQLTLITSEPKALNKDESDQSENRAATIQRINLLRKKLAASRRKIAVQDELIEAEEVLLNDAEKSVNRLQVTYAKLTALELDIDDAEREHAYERVNISKRLLKNDEKRKQSIQLTKERQKHRAALFEEAFSNKVKAQRKAANDSRDAAKKRIDESKEIGRQAKLQVEAARKKLYQHRAKQILDLGRSIESIRNKLAKESQQNAVRAASAAEKQAKIAKGLNDRGINAGAFFRAQRQKRELDKKVIKQQNAIYVRKLEILARVVRQEEEDGKSRDAHASLLCAKSKFQGMSTADQLNHEPQFVSTSSDAKPSTVRAKVSLVNKSEIDESTIPLLEPLLVDPISDKIRPARVIDAKLSEAQQLKISRMLEEAEHRRLQGQKYMIGSREVAPDRAFLAEPAEVSFVDFTVCPPGIEEEDHFYHKVLKLTNVSGKFNSVRWIPYDLSDPLYELINVAYTPAGRIAAGKTLRFDIKFTPGRREASSGSAILNFLAETGHFSIKISWTRQTSCLVVKKSSSTNGDNTLDLGLVQCGDDKLVVLELTNEGALDIYLEAALNVARAEGIEETRVTPVPDREGSCDGNSPEPNCKQLADEVDQLVNDDGMAIEWESQLSTRDFDFVQRDIEILQKQLQFPSYLVIPGYSSKRFSIQYSPFRDTIPHKVSTLLVWNLTNKDDSDQSWSSNRSWTWTLNARCSALNVRIDRSLLDFQSCLQGKLYRDSFSLFNDCKVSVRGSVSIPRRLSSWISIAPTTALIQPRSLTQIQVKLNPDEQLFNCDKDINLVKYVRFDGENDAVSLDVPIRVRIADQAHPLLCRLTAKISRSALKFSASTIEFGEQCWLQVAYEQQVSVTNTSDVLQKVAFPNTSAVFAVEPDQYGFLTLLPHQSSTIRIIFRPSAAVSYSIDLQCHTMLGQLYTIRCLGKGSVSPLILSHSTVKLAACANHCSQRVDLYICNQAATRHSVEISAPDQALSHLAISPRVACLESAQMLRVQIDFCPAIENAGSTRDLKSEIEGSFKREMKANDSEHKKDPKASSVEERMAALTESRLDTVDYSDEREPWSRHAKHTIPIFFRGLKDDSTADEAVHALYLSVETTVVMPFLEVITPGTRLDFGPVAVGQIKLLSFSVRNNHHEAADIAVQMLPSTSPFTVMNALRPLKPGDLQQFTVEFRPQNQIIYTEELSISGQLRLSLKGIGILPKIKLSPDQSKFMMEPILKGQQTSSAFSVLNESEFPLPFEFKTIVSVPQGNLNGSFPFEIRPVKGCLQPGVSQQVHVTFRPDHSRHFKLRVKLDTPNKLDEKIIEILGHAWDAPITIEAPLNQSPGEGFPADNSNGVDPILDPLQFLEQGTCRPTLDVKLIESRIYDQSESSSRGKTEGSAKGKPSANKSLIRTQVHVVTCSTVGGSKSAPASFEFRAVSERASKLGYLRFEPSSGTMPLSSAGSRKSVDISFDKAIWVENVDPCGIIKSLDETIECILKPGPGQQNEFSVRLRAKVQLL